MAQHGDSVFAVHIGRERGIFTTWAETLERVRNHPGAVYKKLSSRAAAEAWLQRYASPDDTMREHTQNLHNEIEDYMNEPLIDI
ncbi:unnamed protein product [Peniophora sp. CBMAI 1063]|nr:unnamed protein product [Peniophora sp. CBMAI 1063]